MSLTTHTECHLSGLFESNCSCYRRLDLYKQIILFYKLQSAFSLRVVVASCYFTILLKLIIRHLIKKKKNTINQIYVTCDLK